MLESRRSITAERVALRRAPHQVLDAPPGRTGDASVVSLRSARTLLKSSRSRLISLRMNSEPTFRELEPHNGLAASCGLPDTRLTTSVSRRFHLSRWCAPSCCPCPPLSHIAGPTVIYHVESSTSSKGRDMKMMIGVLAAILGGGVSISCSAQTPPPHRECAGLTSLTLPDIKIGEAVAVPAGTTGEIRAAHCRVTGVI